MGRPSVFDLVGKWKFVQSALADGRLHRGDISVLVVILDHMDGSGVAWPSLTTIATKSAVAKRNTPRCIKRLCELGYLDRQSGNARASNRYRVGPTTAVASTDAASSSALREGTVTGSRSVLPNDVISVPSLSAPDLTKSNLPKRKEKNTCAEKLRAVVPISLPAGVPRESVEEWIAHRAEKKKPLSQVSLEKTIAALGRYAAAGDDVREIVDHSIANGYQGLFAPTTSTRPRGTEGPSKTAMAIASLQDLKEPRTGPAVDFWSILKGTGNAGSSASEREPIEGEFSHGK